MDYQQAVEEIKKNYDKLSPSVKGEHEAVWVAVSDTADSYEVDEEHVGVRLDGSLVWAYASGCSCWSGDYESKIIPDATEGIKVFAFNHDKAPSAWIDAIVRFAENIGTKNEPVKL